MQTQRKGQTLGEPTLIPGFYEGVGDPEADRLKYMASLADTVSLGVITSFSAGSDKGLVVDIGCGASTSLGEFAMHEGLDYMAVDSNPDYVQCQIRAGHNAVISPAAAIELNSCIADVTHARFLFGWIANARERSHVLREMIRISKEPMRLAVLDYDWSVVDGPDVLKSAVNYVMSILEQRGFDSEYGGKLHDDISLRLTDSYELPAGTRWSENRYPITADTMQDAMPFIELTAGSVMADLQKVGMETEFDELASYLSAVREYAAKHPGAGVKLPDIVALTVDFQTKPSLKNEREKYTEQQRRLGGAGIELGLLHEGGDYETALPDVPSLESVCMALSPGCIQNVRQVQAFTYDTNGIVGQDAIGYDGTLLPHIDPPDQIERSWYLFTRNIYIGAVACVIEPDETGQVSLPTIRRLMEHSPNAYEELRDIIDPKAKVVEVSRFGKNSVHGNIKDALRLLIALAETGRRKGYDYGVMGLEESHVALFQNLFGECALKKLQSPDGVHAIKLDGVKTDKRFVTMIVDAESFLEQIKVHVADPTTKQNTLLKFVADIVEEVLQDRAIT